MNDDTIYKKSKKRDRILELLRGTDTHPTADWLYNKLKTEYPNLSLGTVYRNLGILVKQGLVQKLEFGSTFDRYEAKIDIHHHLICEKCGSVVDLDMAICDDVNSRVKELTGFEVKRHRVELFGVCNKCSN